MADILDAIARHLQATGHGTYNPDGVAAGEWPIFLGGLPQSPGLAIALFTYPGAAPDPSLPFDTPRVQVRVRGDRDSRTSDAKARAIYGELHGLGATNLPGGVWLQLALGVQSGPLPLGPDTAGQHEHTVNFDVEWLNPTAHRPA